FRRLPAPPDGRGQRRRAPEADAGAPPGRAAGDPGEARPRPLGAGLLRGVRRPAEKASGGKGSRGVGRATLVARRRFGVATSAVAYRVGIDVGGTFTDFVLAAAGKLVLDKHPTPPPIGPGRRRYGVPERLDFEGRVVVPLDEEAVRRACRRMKLQAVDSLAVVFLFSFVDSAHERRVREIAAEELPGVMVSLSHEVMPSAPEFERTSTTLVNAYVGPRISRYLSRLEGRLRAAGFAGELLIMQSNGGVMPGGYVT